MTKKLTSTMAVAAALGLSACGSDDEQAAAGAEAAGTGVDRAFVADMVPHHESAVEMAEIALQRGESEFVKMLASDIVETQSAEIETLKAEDAELAEAGVEAGDLGVPDHMMGMEADTATLETAEAFDEAFLNMMIPHHEGAVVMAEAEIEKGADPELMELAEQIVATQQAELSEMTTELGGAVTDGAGHSG